MLTYPTSILSNSIFYGIQEMCKKLQS